MRTNRLVSAADLVVVTTEVGPDVFAVILDNLELQFAHVGLRRELESALSRVGCRSETLEAVRTDYESQLEPGASPGWVDASGDALRGLHSDLWLDEDRLTFGVDGRVTERLRINSESVATVRTFPGVPEKSALTDGVATGCEIAVILTDSGLVTELGDDLLAADELEQRLCLGSFETFDQKVLPEENRGVFEKLEVDRGIRQEVGLERSIDRLRVSGEHLLPSLAVLDDKLGAGTVDQHAANVSIGQMDDLLSKSVFSSAVGALEGIPHPLDTNQWPHATVGGQGVAVFGRSNLGFLTDLTAHFGVRRELRANEGLVENGSLLHNRANGVRKTSFEGSAIENVDVWSLTNEGFRDVTTDTVDVLGGEVLDVGWVQASKVAGAEARSWLGNVGSVKKRRVDRCNGSDENQTSVFQGEKGCGATSPPRQRWRMPRFTARSLPFGNLAGAASLRPLLSRASLRFRSYSIL